MFWFSTVLVPHALMPHINNLVQPKSTSSLLSAVCEGSCALQQQDTFPRESYSHHQKEKTSTAERLQTIITWNPEEPRRFSPHQLCHHLHGIAEKCLQHANWAIPT